MKYNNSFKKKLCEEICLLGKSTMKTAEAYNVPLKTLEKWITSFHKNQHCFDFIEEEGDFKFLYVKNDDVSSYDDLSNAELKKQLLKKDIEIARLKKGYLVKEGGTGEKEFITFSKKNTK